MLKESRNHKINMIAAVLFLMSITFLSFVGCGSDRLVDQNEKQVKEIVESIQSGFAEEGWTYTGYEVVDTDEENDTVTVSMFYDVDGDAKQLLGKNASEKPVNDDIYSLAEDINVKVTAELSAYDKENGGIGCGVTSTEWFVGDTKVNEWIKEQNKKQEK